MHSINLDIYENPEIGNGEELMVAKSLDGKPSSVNSIVEDKAENDAAAVLIVGGKVADTDENDNSSTDARLNQKRSSVFERLFYRTDSPSESVRRASKNFAYKSQAVGLPHDQPIFPDRRTTPPTMKLEQQSSPGSSSATSGIIFHRTYNKKPSQGSSGAADDRIDSAVAHPVIRLGDSRWRISPNRPGVDPARTGNPTERSNGARSCIIRRSFHKDTAVTSDVAKVFQEHETSSHSEETKQGVGSPQFRRRISNCSNVKKDHHVSPPATPETCPVVSTEEAVPERMDVCEENDGQRMERDCDEDKAVEASSMVNSYGDAGSSGCSNQFSTQPTSSCRRVTGNGRVTMSEFDLMLQKINQTIPPMSHLDRIDQWRVTAEDLLHSIPTKAQIESSSTCAKRPHYDDAEHMSSEDDSDNLEDDAGAACGHKKRRTFKNGQKEAPLSSPNAAIANTLVLGNETDNDGKGLDFRKSQVNPEIDKSHPQQHPGTGVRILERKNYHKLPTRYRPGTAGNDRDSNGDSVNGSGTSGSQSPCDVVKPYAQLLSRGEEERDKFLQYLRISPVFRTEERQRAEMRSEHRTTVIGCGDDANRLKKPLCPSSVVRPKSVKSRINENNRKQNSRKTNSKNRAHPAIIASSGLRGVRRLVLSSSLRSGKVIRYRNSFVNVRQLSKPKPKKVDLTPGPVSPKSPPEKAREERPVRDKPIPPKAEPHLGSPVPSGSSSGSMAKRTKRSTVRPRNRCSVDSAVSSSTSAEMLVQAEKQSKECQTVETFSPEMVPPPPPPTPSPINEGKRLRNPINRNDGDVQHLFLVGERLVVVQKDLVSFWRYSRLCVLLGVKQEWQRVGQIRRWNRDTEVDAQNANRIVFNHQEPIYLEPRGRNLSDDKSRTCPLASIYLNAYFTAPGEEKSDSEGKEGTDDEQLRLKSFQLDTVKSALEDIRFVPLPNTCDFLVCWYEHVSELESRTGLCKYSLTPDLQTLACIREFVTIKQKLTALKCINDKKLLGLGSTTVHIWCYESGFLLRTVDLKIELGLIVGSFLHVEACESTLFMVQMQQPEEQDRFNQKLVKVIAINLSKPTWYIAHSYEVALASMSITSESQQWALDDSHGCHRHCLTFASGEVLLLSLNDMTVCWTNHQRLQKDLQRVEGGSVHICNRLRSNDGSNDMYRPRERILNACHWNGGRDLVFLSDQFLTVKTIDEYLLEEAKR